MQEDPNAPGGSVEPFPGSSQTTAVSDEPRRILGLLQTANPNAAKVSFEFDGQLHAHIDLRRIEEMSIVEERLRYIGGGQFFPTSAGARPPTTRSITV